MAQWGAKFVKCPYYHKHDSNKIVCEGLLDRNTIHLVYESPSDRKTHMTEYCNSIKWCRLCPIHSVLDLKHEEE